nr:hypothetical protein [Comamonas jiangduensis]
MPSRFLRWSAALRSAPSGLALSLALSAGALQAQTTAAPIEVRNAQGKPVVSALAWKAPAAARMQFTVQGKFKNLPYQTKAQLDWLPQGQRYEASQEVQIPVLGSRRQASVGAINANGLRPEIFLDRSRKENSATFDAQAGQIRFSRGSEPAPLVPGTQDRMSVFFQLAGMLAAAPKAYPAGTRITVQAASTSRVAPGHLRSAAQKTSLCLQGAWRPSSWSTTPTAMMPRACNRPCGLRPAWVTCRYAFAWWKTADAMSWTSSSRPTATLKPH